MKILKCLFVIGLIAFSLSGCKYSFIVPEDVIDPTDPEAPKVSFKNDIQPIFDNNCVFCHNGSRNPNLTPDNSYASITSGYVNLEKPEESLIYTKPHPTAGGSHAKYTDAQAALVLTWITQGAKDN